MKKYPEEQIQLAGIVVFHIPSKKTLILRGRYWDLPKGHVEKGETPLQGAIRECWEETGLQVDIYPYTYVNIPSKKLIRMYLGTTKDSNVILSEHSQYYWLKPSDAIEVLSGDLKRAMKAICMLAS